MQAGSTNLHPDFGPLREGLRTPTALVAPTWGHPGKTAAHRSYQTIQGLGEHLGQPIMSEFAQGQEKELADSLVRDHSGVVLICWEHKHIPDIAAALPVAGGTPVPRKWPRDRYDVMEYPVGISYYAFGAAEVTHWLSGSPNLLPRGAMSQGELYGDPEVLRESLMFTTVNVLGFGFCALLAAWFLTGVHRRRPWDAALFAVSPVLLFEGLINWDLLAVACVAGALFAQSRDRAGWTGVAVHREEDGDTVAETRYVRRDAVVLLVTLTDGRGESDAPAIVDRYLESVAGELG